MPRRSSKPPVGSLQNGPRKGAHKCQRPRTTGARTSGAAELFSGRPSAGAMKHRRRRWMQDSSDRDVSQGGLPPPRIVRLLRHLSHHRPPHRRRRRNRLRRLLHLNLFCRLAHLPNRSVRERDHQYRQCDNCTQNACYFFRVHLDIPARLSRTLPRKIAKLTPSVCGSAAGFPALTST